MNNTKNNHYVPKFYLKKFLDTDQKIWKLDKTNSKIYHPNNLKTECSSKNLYTVKNKITSTEVDIIIRLFELDKKEMHRKTLKHLTIFLNDEIAKLLKVEYPIDKNIEKILNDSLNRDLNNSTISRTQEILITELFENKFIPIYEQILNTSSINFINQKINDSIALYACTNITKFVYKYLERKCEQLINSKFPNGSAFTVKTNIYFDLILYFFFQELRTEDVVKKLKESLVASKLQEHININSENFSFLTILMLLIRMSEKIFFINSPFKFVLIKNNTNLKFITSDCPCVNIYSSFIEDRLLQEHEIEFLFPLSPNISLLMTDKICYTSDNIIITKEKDIDIYNKTIIKTAKRYVYANSQNLLKRYVDNN